MHNIDTLETEFTTRVTLPWVSTHRKSSFLSSEVDGVRVMTSECHDIIRRVPIALVNVYSIGSTNVSFNFFIAVLASARIHFDLSS